MGLILFIVAQVTVPVFNLLGLVYSLFRWKSLKEYDKYLEDVAISKDQLSNTVMRYLFNDIMIKKGGYPYGDPDQTLSYVFGKNKQLKKLTWFGMFWANFLNKLDKNHVEDAVVNEEGINT